MYLIFVRRTRVASFVEVNVIQITEVSPRFVFILDMVTEL